MASVLKRTGLAIAETVIASTATIVVVTSVRNWDTATLECVQDNTNAYYIHNVGSEDVRINAVSFRQPLEGLCYVSGTTLCPGASVRVHNNGRALPDKACTIRYQIPSLVGMSSVHTKTLPICKRWLQSRDLRVEPLNT